MGQRSPPQVVQENLEILMKVADAVAFAHSRGVLHRDLKPKVMLGDFGEVLLMDWGLAIRCRPAAGARGGGDAGLHGPGEWRWARLANRRRQRRLPAGRDPLRILTGSPPYSGKTVMDCLTAAARNELRPTEETGELLDIALRAMATRPEDTVSERGAISGPRSGNIMPIRRASAWPSGRVGAGRSVAGGCLRGLRPGPFGFQEAFALWSGNAKAREGGGRASLAYAGSSPAKATTTWPSLLDPATPARRGPRQIRAAQQERDSRQKRLQAAKRLAGLLVLTVRSSRGLPVDPQRTDNAPQRPCGKGRRREASNSGIAAGERAAAAAEGAERQAGNRDSSSGGGRPEGAAARTDEDSSGTARRAAAKPNGPRSREQAASGIAYVARIGLAAAKIEENAFQRAPRTARRMPALLAQLGMGPADASVPQHVREVDPSSRSKLHAVLSRPTAGVL